MLHKRKVALGNGVAPPDAESTSASHITHAVLVQAMLCAHVRGGRCATIASTQSQRGRTSAEAVSCPSLNAHSPRGICLPWALEEPGRKASTLGAMPALHPPCTKSFLGRGVNRS